MNLQPQRKKTFNFSPPLVNLMNFPAHFLALAIKIIQLTYSGEKRVKNLSHGKWKMHGKNIIISLSFPSLHASVKQSNFISFLLNDFLSVSRWIWGKFLMRFALRCNWEKMKLQWEKRLYHIFPQTLVDIFISQLFQRSKYT